MSTVNTKMTALADEVRELSGTTNLLGIDDMTSAINTENTNFNSNLNSQNTLIQQIQTALEGKAAGGTTSEDLDAEISEYTSLNAELEEVINSLPEAGGGSGDLDSNQIRRTSIMHVGYNQNIEVFFVNGWTWNDFNNSCFNSCSLNTLGVISISGNTVYHGDEIMWVLLTADGTTQEVKPTDLILESSYVFEYV